MVFLISLLFALANPASAILAVLSIGLVFFAARSWIVIGVLLLFSLLGCEWVIYKITVAAGMNWDATVLNLIGMALWFVAILALMARRRQRRRQSLVADPQFTDDELARINKSATPWLGE